MKNATIFLFLLLLFISFAVSAQTENVVYPRSYDAKLSDVYISDSDEGFAVGSCGVILRTTDAGLNWDLVSDAGGGWDYTTVACPDDDCGRAVIIGDNIILRRQPDGTFTSETDELFTDILVLHHLTGGVLVGDRTFNGYIRSGDGGATWTEMTLTGTPNQDNRLSFVNNSLTGYSFNTEHELQKTTDGGLTWAPTGFVNTDSHLNMHWRTDPLLSRRFSELGRPHQRWPRRKRPDRLLQRRYRRGFRPDELPHQNRRRRPDLEQPYHQQPQPKCPGERHRFP